MNQLQLKIDCMMFRADHVCRKSIAAPFLFSHVIRGLSPAEFSRPWMAGWLTGWLADSHAEAERPFISRPSVLLHCSWNPLKRTPAYQLLTGNRRFEFLRLSLAAFNGWYVVIVWVGWNDVCGVRYDILVECSVTCHLAFVYQDRSIFSSSGYTGYRRTR